MTHSIFPPSPPSSSVSPSPFLHPSSSHQVAHLPLPPHSIPLLHSPFSFMLSPASANHSAASNPPPSNPNPVNTRFFNHHQQSTRYYSPPPPAAQTPQTTTNISTSPHSFHNHNTTLSPIPIHPLRLHPQAQTPTPTPPPPETATADTDMDPSTTSHHQAQDQAQYPESRVLVVMTGGTICMRSGPEGLVPARGFLESAMKPRPSFNDGSVPDSLPVMVDGQKRYLPSLRTPPSSYSRHIRYTMYEFPTLLDSSSISSDGWTQIANTIAHNYALFDGFVVLHGTDSLAYTSSALSFMLAHLGKPVILTGSQASIFALQSDAVDNLLGSLIIAGTFMIPEVCLFFHHTLYRGNRSTKVSASAFEAFASPNCEPLAKVTSVGINVNWNLVRRPRELERFDVHTVLDTGHVACLRIFPGIKPAMLDSVLRVSGLRGLILETFGAGNAPQGEDGSLTAVISSAVERGIVIVNVSQCYSGTVSPLYAPATILGRAGVIFGHDLTTEAALTKLSYLLALPALSYTDIISQMALSLRGEMTELASTQFAHPPHHDEPSLTPAQVAFTALGHAVAAGDRTTVLGLLEIDTHRLLAARDYAGNTALHLAAIGPDPLILRELLLRGASVHVRNKARNTPLFLAEKIGRREHVEWLKESGAHLHIEETEEERLP